MSESIIQVDNVDCRCGGEGQLLCLDDSIPQMDMAYTIACEDCDNTGPIRSTAFEATETWNNQEGKAE